MCRLFFAQGKINSRVTAEAMVSMASGRNYDHGHLVDKHPNGWGAAFSSNGHSESDIQIMRGSGPIWETNIPAILSALNPGKVLLHARHTFDQKLGIEYSHPFIRGETAFIHNGVVPGLDDVLGRPTRLDSEDLFEFLLPDPERDIDDKDSVVHRLKSLPRGLTSANCMAMNSRGTLIVNWFPETLASEKFYTLWKCLAEGFMIIASEPLALIQPPEKWRPLGHGYVEFFPSNYYLGGGYNE